MKIELDSIIELGDNGLDIPGLKSEAAKISEYLNSFKQRDQGFVMLPKMRAQLLAVKTLAEKFRGKYKDIVVLGIGGSALGITCLRDALKGPYWNLSKNPRLFVLDNMDLVDEVEKIIDVDNSLFIVISKSGTTPETMAMYYYFRSKVSKTNFVFITDPEDGELRKIGKIDDIPCLEIPKNVGGRFSVLSPVGLFPAALLDIDIEGLLEGAADMLEHFYSLEFELNFPFQIASLQFLLEKKDGIHMTVMMPYSSYLLSFADWYRQLLAESIGKNGLGLTPISALGVTDQHSQLQLYNEGPNDKLIVMIGVGKEDGAVVPEVSNEKLSYLSGVSMLKLMNVEKKATRDALFQYKKPVLNIEIDKIDAFTLGQLFMLFEGSIAFLGEYYRIDAFNQPGVELGKKLTKEILSKS